MPLPLLLSFATSPNLSCPPESYRIDTAYARSCIVPCGTRMLDAALLVQTAQLGQTIQGKPHVSLW